MPAATSQLAYSARNRDYKGVKRALQHGADVNVYEDGDNPLHWAAFWGDREIAQLLLEAGADPNLENKFGRDALEDAYREKQREVTELLELWRKKDTAELVHRGRDLMESAVRKQQPAVLKEFIDKEKHNFLMKTHVETAEVALAKILKEQERAVDKMSYAMSTHDIDGLEAAIQMAVEIISMVGPPRHPGLVEAERRLEELGLETQALQKKLKLISEADFKDAQIEVLEKHLQTVKASPLSKRLDLQPVTEKIASMQAERERLELKVKGAINTAKRAEDPTDPEVLEALENTIIEIEPMKPLKMACTTARNFLTEMKAAAETPAKGKKKK